MRPVKALTWHARRTIPGNIVIHDTFLGLVAHLEASDFKPIWRKEAEARMIEAAPAMYRALTEAMNALEDYIERIEKLQNASLNYGRKCLDDGRRALAIADNEKPID